MRNNVNINKILPILICIIAVTYFVLAFLTLHILVKVVFILITVAILVFYANRKAFRVDKNANYDLPPIDNTNPIIFVCGDVNSSVFIDEKNRSISSGCYVKIQEVNRLSLMTNKLMENQPQMVGQLAVMFSCIFDGHKDEALLRASLKELRLQIKKLKADTGYAVPVLLNCHFSGPETPWIIAMENDFFVCPDKDGPISVTEWQQKMGMEISIPIIQQAFNFIQNVILDELSKVDEFTPSICPLAITLRGGYVPPVADGLWSQWLYHQSYLLDTKSSTGQSPNWYFPDPIFPFISPYLKPLQGGRSYQYVLLFLLFLFITSLYISIVNNRDLIYRISADLKRWYAIPMENYQPKLEALKSLKSDIQILERWQREGEPTRYDLGMYQGEHLWLHLQKAIDTYIPPPKPVEPPPVEEEPKPIRLDSMSLFNSGQSDLKANSTKVLIDSLLDIKAKPGWLILVSGHTDNTGSEEFNQILSLKRAESVRNWMRDTGDVPESCFAVQGYGSSFPVATNDTMEGRALNRRVEISLVPQVGACKVLDVNELPSSIDGFTEKQME